MLINDIAVEERKKKNKKLEREIEFAWDAASELRCKSLVVFSLFENGLLQMKKIIKIKALNFLNLPV